MKTQSLLAGFVLVAAAVVPAAAQPPQIDPAIASYQKASGISGTLSSVGSDTCNNLMTFWAEAFQMQYPNVRIQIEGKGSSTAPPALISGTSQLGPMSRPMKATEIDAFEKKYGYKPTTIRIAIDALAVFLHKDNPLDRLTMPQLDAIFSKTRKGGGKKDLSTWGDLGLTGDWASRPISLYGRNSASGTYGFFKEHALYKGDYKNTVKEQPGSASVVQGVTEDRYGIGYSGIGYKTSGVKTAMVAKGDSDTFFGTDPDSVLSGKYPLSRFLYLNINKAPNRPLDPLVAEFVKLVLSREGQEAVVKDGFLPLSSRLVEEELAKLQ